MVASAAGIAAAGTVLESCGQKKPAEAQFEKTAKEGAKIVSRDWARLGDTVGLLGLGCMRLPKASDGSIDQEHTNKMVAYAIEHGINYFDTASGYAGSEEAMGKALSSHPRESYMIATKLSNHRSPVKSLEDGQKIFNSSLQKLQIEYFDFYLLHNLPSDAALHERFVDNGLLDWLIQQKKEGKIRHLGFSFHGNDREFMKILEGNYYDWDFVQIQLNYLDYDSDAIQSRRCYETIVKHGKKAIVMEPVKGGTLAKVNPAVEEMFKAYAPEASIPSWAVRFAASHPEVMIVLSGMSNLEQVEDNTSYMADFKPLNEDEYRRINRAVELINGDIAIPCTGCSYCTDGCPMHIAIPRYFALYNADKQSVKDNGWQSHGEYYYNLTGTYGKASDCIGCGQCEAICPQHLPIREHLKSVAELFES